MKTKFAAKELNVAAASNGNAAVLVAELNPLLGYTPFVVVRYAPKSIGRWENRDEMNALVDRAVAKLGFKRDRRCKSGFRKIGVAA